MIEQFPTITRSAFLRTAAAALGAAGVGGALTACQPGRGTPRTPGSVGAANIAFFEWGDINDKDIADATIADFEKANPNIKVRLEQPTGNYYEKLQTVLAGGVAPDVLNMQTWRFQPFAAKGAIDALDTYRSRDNYNTPYPAAWKSVYDPQTKFRGKLYGVPWNMNSMVIFYARDQFDRAGLKYPTDEWTYREFVETLRRLTRTESGVRYYGYQTNTSYERLACWMRLNGDKEWDTEIEPKRALWDQPRIVEALNFQLYDVINTIKASPTPAEMQGGTNQLQSGNVAMKMEGPWFMPQMMGPKAKREGGTPFDVVMLPRGEGGRRAHMVFGHVLTLNRASKAKDAAWEFMKFAGGEGGQKHVAQGGRQPVTPEFNERFWVPLAKQQFGLQNTSAFIKAFETGILHFAAEMNDLYLYNEVLKEAFDKMIAGQATARDLIPAVNTRLQQILDEYWRQRR